MIFAQALSLSLGAAILGLAGVAAASNSTCHEYVLISTRGTYEPQGPSIAFPGMISQTMKNLPGGAEYDTVYPANTSLQVNIASDDITRYISTSMSKCPAQVYGLLGYSQGAVASAFLLKTLIQDDQTALLDAIKAVLVVGNPGHVDGTLGRVYAAAEVDEFGGGLTQHYNGSYYYDGAGQIPEQFYVEGKIFDICHTQDIFCASTYPNAAMAPYHLQYGSTPGIQDMGAKFLTGKLQIARSNATGTPVSYTGAAGIVRTFSSIVMGICMFILLVWLS